MVDAGSNIFNFVSGIPNHISELPQSEALIFGVATILIICMIFAFIARALRQPLIPAYVITGLIAGPLFLGLITSQAIIYTFLEIGIVFLLFTAGLEISLQKIKEANIKKILIIGTLQVLAMFGILYAFHSFLGLSGSEAVCLGIILAFSSTMVDIKLLADRGELVTLHGRLVIGILLLQDLVAIGAIAFLTTGSFSVIPLLMTFLKLGIIVVIAIFIKMFFLNRLYKFASCSNELLFVTGLGNLFLFIALSYVFELSIAIGAFIAGLSLSNSPFKTELESRMSPLKDFFSILFFVALGMQIVFVGIGGYTRLLIFLILAAIIIKPIITYILLKLGQYTSRTSAYAAISLGQLSEFSLIIALLAVSLGKINNSMLSTIILATVITMTITPYLINSKNYIYNLIIRKNDEYKIKEHIKHRNKTMLIIGAHRTGSIIINELLKEKRKIIILDHDPEIINILNKNKIDSIYGDVLSPEILYKVNIINLKLAISTIPNFDANLFLLRKIKKINPEAIVIVTASRISETMKLYEEGADYVITPKIVAGQEMVPIINSGKKRIDAAKKKHLKYIKKIHNLLY